MRILALATFALVTLTAGNAFAKRVKVNILNCVDDRAVHVCAYDGRDKAMMTHKSHRKVPFQQTVQLHCEGEGKGRCKLKLRLQYGFNGCGRSSGMDYRNVNKNKWIKVTRVEGDLKYTKSDSAPTCD